MLRGLAWEQVQASPQQREELYDRIDALEVLEEVRILLFSAVAGRQVFLSAKERGYIATCAAATGSLGLVQWALECAGCLVTDQLISTAARVGNLDMVKYLSDEWNCQCSAAVMANAALSGNLPLVQWVFEAKGQWHEDALAMATKSGNLALAQWIHDQKRKCGKALVTEYAAHQSSADMMVWCIVNGYPVSDRTIQVAALKGNLTLVKLLYEHHIPEDIGPIVKSAAQSGNVDLLKFLGSKGAPMTYETLEAASSSGSVGAMSWLFREKLITIGCDGMNAAIKSGATDAVQWYLDNLFVLPSTALCLAVSSGKPKMIEFILSSPEGLHHQWDQKACLLLKQSTAPAIGRWARKT